MTRSASYQVPYAFALEEGGERTAEGAPGGNSPRALGLAWVSSCLLL
jgi:hypothetical protein